MLLAFSTSSQLNQQSSDRSLLSENSSSRRSQVDVVLLKRALMLYSSGFNRAWSQHYHTKAQWSKNLLLWHSYLYWFTEPWLLFVSTFSPYAVNTSARLIKEVEPRQTMGDVERLGTAALTQLASLAGPLSSLFMSKKKAYKIENIAAVTGVPQAKRIRITYGPYKVKAANVRT